MMSLARLILIVLIAICAIATCAPKQMVFGFGKRSFDDYDADLVQDAPMKRYKPKSFAMGFGKRGNVRSFNMGFGKRSSDDFDGVIYQPKVRSVKDDTWSARKFSMGLGKRSIPLSLDYEEGPTRTDMRK